MKKKNEEEEEEEETKTQMLKCNKQQTFYWKQGLITGNFIENKD